MSCVYTDGFPIVTSSDGGDANGSGTASGATGPTDGDPEAGSEIETDTTASECPPPTHRVMERLQRAAIAVQRPEGEGGGIYLGWRLLGSDPEDTTFNLFRNGVLVNTDGPIATSTNYVDADGVPGDAYQVATLVGETEVDRESVRLLAQNFLVVPLATPQFFIPGDGAVGDLDGDGEYEIVIKQERFDGPGPVDLTTNVTATMLEAYRLDGERLWRIALGPNVGEGNNVTQFLVYDFDGDGRAELVTRAANGTIDGVGDVIGDETIRDPKDPAGKVIAGDEFLVVFDGLTGALVDRVDYEPARGAELASWGADPSNDPTNDADFANRYVAAVAYLDGVHPSIVTGRGYFARTALAAWDYSESRLRRRWTFDSADYEGETRRAYEGQGSTQLSVADVDDDGRDEIVHGSLVIDDDGAPVYAKGWGGGATMHVADLDPEVPGLEVFNVHGRPSDHIVNFRSAGDGTELWSKASPDGISSGPGQALAADIDPSHPGAEMWVAGPDQDWDPETEGLERPVFDVHGDVIGQDPPSTDFAIWWDGDLLRELLAGVRIDKFALGEPAEPLLVADCLHTPGVYMPGGERQTPTLTADLFGDWREEVICRGYTGVPDLGVETLRIYTTIDPTEHRFTTLMHDPLYRLGVASQNVAYNQTPHTSYFLGDGMDPPPRHALDFPCQPDAPSD